MMFLHSKTNTPLSLLIIQLLKNILLKVASVKFDCTMIASQCESLLQIECTMEHSDISECLNKMMWEE